MDNDQQARIAKLEHDQARLVIVIRTLVGADNCNYQRDTMRYCGYFEDARTVLREVTGEGLARPDRNIGYDPLVWRIREQEALLETVLEEFAPDRDLYKQIRALLDRPVEVREP